MIDNREKNLPKKVLTGVFWNNISSYVQSGVRFLGIVYLARQIDPVYFGKQGLAASIVALIYSVVMFGQEYAIPRQKGDVSAYVSMHVFLRIIMTALIGVILVGLYFFLNIFNGTTFKYVLILFFAQLPSQVTAIYVVFMERNLLFSRIAIINIVSIACAVPFSCILASRGYTIWALLWLLMAEYIVRALITMALSPKIFMPKVDKKLAMEFLKYGRYVFLSNLISRSHGRIADISVGTFVGEAALGFYQRAYGLGGLLHQIVTGGVSAVATPVFAAIREDRERLGKYFELMGSLILRLAIGGYVWMAIVFPEVIVLLYGEKWLPTVLIFRLMLPYALIQSFNIALETTHFAAGDSSRVARIKFVEFMILALLLYPFIFLYKAAGAAIAIDISALVGTGLFLFYLRPLAKVSFKQLFLSPVIAVVAGVVAWKVSSFFIHSYPSIWVKVIADTLIFVSVYFIALIAVELSYLKNVYYLLKNQIMTEIS